MQPAEAASRRGRLRRPSRDGRPVPDGAASARTGLNPVVLGSRRLGLCHLPPEPPERLVLLLHGAGGSAAQGLGLLTAYADERRLALFAPQSVGPTWDVIGGRYGPDVALIQVGLDQVGTWLPPGGIPTAVGGFSDGGSYALSLGLINGDVFDAVLAFSPGFMAPTSTTGVPSCFVSHGRDDPILPVDRCSRRVVAALRTAGYPVQYHEFDGGHEVPPAVATEALDWLSTRPAAPA